MLRSRLERAERLTNAPDSVAVLVAVVSPQEAEAKAAEFARHLDAGTLPGGYDAASVRRYIDGVSAGATVNGYITQ